MLGLLISRAWAFGEFVVGLGVADFCWAKVAKHGVGRVTGGWTVKLVTCKQRRE